MICAINLCSKGFIFITMFSHYCFKKNLYEKLCSKYALANVKKIPENTEALNLRWLT